MAEIPLQTLEEMDLTAEQFEELVTAGLEDAVNRVLGGEDVETALAQADQSSLDLILTVWAFYVTDTLMPALDASMVSAGLEVVSRLASVLNDPLSLLQDQAYDTGQYLQQAQNRLVGIGDELWFNARMQLAEGLAAGESQPQLAQRVRDAVGVTEPRARVIARTESHGARNTVAAATMQRFESAYGIAPGVMQKRWQATNDLRTRLTHHEADGQTVGFADPFTVGGFSLAFPGDPAGPPQEVIECRCVTYAVFDPEDLNLSDNGAIITLNAAAYREEQSAVTGDELFVLTASVRRSGWSDMPVAPASRPWDGAGAAGRLAASCGVDEADASAEAWNCYAEGFLYRDDEADAQTKGAYKLGIVDIIDGRKMIVPRGVFAVAGVLRGARGGTSIPEEQQRSLRSVVASLYGHINDELDTDYAAPWEEGDSATMTAAAMPRRNVAPWSGVIVVEGAPAYDGQEYAPGALTWPELGATESLEIPLGWKYERAHGGVDNGNTVDVGRVDSIERVGNELHARGVLDLDSPWGREAARQMGTRENPGFLAGISIIDDSGPQGDVEVVLPEGCEDMPDDAAGSEIARCMTAEKVIYHSGRIRSADLVSIPAFVEARVYLDDDADIPESDTATPDTEVVTASAYTITIPDLPPIEWFDEPKEAPEIGAITVTDEGRFFGYLAPKHVAHRSYRNKRVTVPTGNVDYGIWMNRATMVDDGRGGFTKIATGPITMDCGHAPQAPKGAARREHYDNACSVVATARVGENARGVWISGALIPGVDASQVARMMACQLSGDWGPHREQPGKRELAAALLVPVPGFPTRSRSFTIQGGELARTVTPVRFGTHAGVDEPVGMQAAADRIAAEVGRDRETRMREFAYELRSVLRGD
jgi:Phage Mu protein F like protein